MRNTGDQKEYDAIVVVTPADFTRLSPLHERIVRLLPVRRVIFVGSHEVGDLLDGELAREEISPELKSRVGFMPEDAILSFDAVQTVMDRLAGDGQPGGHVPRRVTGWYYQQFLKLAYADRSEDEYYMSWDGDTVPCKEFSMFSDEGTPYLDYKREYHEEYFKTMRTLTGLSKVIEPSFISEHMLFRCDLVRALRKRITDNDTVPGTTWWEKILCAIRPEKLLENSFSEFETYGTFVALTAPGAYRLREWHSFRYAAEFFEIDRISERDYYWLSRDFTAASFEKNMTIREDHRGLFDNPAYQEKISARQMLEAVQAEFDEGYLEKWDLPRVVTKPAGEEQREQAPEDAGKVSVPEKPARLRYLEEHTYREYEAMGDVLTGKNADQAYLCYENAAFLAPEEAEQARLTKKKEALAKQYAVDVRRVCILILSYNQRYLTQKCLESIADNCDPANVSVIVLDNASADDSPKWLQEYMDTHKAEDGNIEMMLLLSDENLGFPAGCNAAAQYAPEDADLFLLNNDTRLPAGALFRLRMSLYEKEDIGAAGAVQNYNANKDQTQEVELSLPEQYMAYGAKHNRTVNDPPEEKKKLSGFAMLIRHGLYHALGGFDERFSPGYYEDDDLCLRIRREGYRLVVCRGSFIYHAGSQSFAKRPGVEELVERNRLKFIDKWGAEAEEADGNR